MGPGITLIHGLNGHGKSNLLEAVYMLVIGKSSRTSTDKDVLRLQPVTIETHTQVTAEVEQEDGRIKMMIGFRVSPPDRVNRGSETDVTDGLENATVQKYIRVNGLPRRAADLVGELNGVMFGAQDLELVYGSPSARRRYLDIINSQIDGSYLRSLQRYQRVLQQRNHLLKNIRAGRSSPDELRFWDDELVTEGSYIMSQRQETIRGLVGLARPIHGELTDGAEEVDLEYAPSVPLNDHPPEALSKRLADLLKAERDREVAQGVTVLGPHRDDMRILVDRRDAAAYGSRGQARTATLAVKLAEAPLSQQQKGT